MRICFAAARGQRLTAAAGAATIMLVTGCTVSTVSTGVPVTSPPAGSSAQPAGGTYSLPAGVRSLKVSNPAGTVRVTAANGSPQIHVTEHPTGKPTAYRQASGSTGTIGSSCPGTGNCHMDYQIQLPPSTALDVVGDAGQVVLSGGLTSARVDTHAGKVSGTGLGHGSFTVATQAGEVDLAFASAPALAKVTTEAGTIDVTVPSGRYKVSASSDIGTKDVTVPNDGNASNVIDLHARIGSVSLHQG
jgi:hypothetical protein